MGNLSLKKNSMVKNFLLEIFRVLKPDGVQRIVVPDLYYLCKSYVENHEKCMRMYEDV